MKRILLSLLIFNLLFINCHADEYSTDGDYSISLNCTNAPVYSVKVPYAVNVTNKNTTMNFYVKGDIYADQHLWVVFDSSSVLYSNDRTVPVVIIQEKSSWSSSELNNAYVSSGVSISHTELSAGTWSGYMNVAISLQGGN